VEGVEQEIGWLIHQNKKLWFVSSMPMDAGTKVEELFYYPLFDMVMLPEGVLLPQRPLGEEDPLW